MADDTQSSQARDPEVEQGRKLYCEIRTPDGPVWSGLAASVTVPGAMGSMGILPRHAPLMSSLEVGLVDIKEPGGDRRRFVTGLGFVEIYRNHVLLLVDFADGTEGIDIERATASRDRAAKRMRTVGETVDQARAEAALKRALMRLRFAGQPRI